MRAPDFLFPVSALGRIFRARFLHALSQGQPGAAQRKRRYRDDWVVYAKAPLGGTAQVLQFLGR